MREPVISEKRAKFTRDLSEIFVKASPSALYMAIETRGLSPDDVEKSRALGSK